MNTTHEVNASYKYSDTHEWVFLLADDVVLIGVTAYAQHALGDVVYVTEPEIGKYYDTGKQMGTIDSVKVSAELYMPVSGTVIEFNERLKEEPELINNSPYEEGWIAKIKISDATDLNKLLSASEYTELTGNVG